MRNVAATTAQFEKDTKDHVLEIVHEDGVNRHLLCSKGSSSTHYFGIVTWPMHLCIYGDMGTYVFRRHPDMFEFHRGSGPLPFYYWAEKLESTSRCEGYKEYSAAAFKHVLDVYFHDWVDSRDLDDRTIRKAVREELDELVESAECEYEAHSLARDFVSSSGHTLEDFWEQDLTELKHNYIWCCLAIRKAISMYDEARAAGESSS